MTKSDDTPESFPGGISPALLLESAKVKVPDQQTAPLPARHGQLGLCLCCKQGAAIHWDVEGRFLGCPDAKPGMVFLLVPVTVPNGDHAADEPPPATRRFQRARYFPTPQAKEQVSSLSDQRRRVLQALLTSSKAGALARDLIARTGLPHGSVQQALSWLQDHDLADAKEDSVEGTTSPR